MNRRTLPVIVFSCAIAFSAIAVADNPPSETSIKQLLEVGQVHRLVDTMIVQMDSYMKQAMQQATQGQPITPAIQKDIDRRQAEFMAAFKEILDWSKLEPMYVRVYQKSFTQNEVDGLVAFYKTPSGQALINKMPVVMQNTLTEVQQMMQPMMQKVHRMQEDVVAEIQAQKKKGGS